MKWLQVSVEVDAEAAEAVADVFNRYVSGGVVIEALETKKSVTEGLVSVKAYLPLGPDTSQIQDQLERALWHMGQLYPIPAPEFTAITEANWADLWKDHYHPLRIGRRIVIKPTWRHVEVGPDDVLLELDPGMAFGTGLHPTTQTCLMALEDKVQAGMRVLDLGTGSGILALAAAKLGAGAVLALDTDPVAVAAARENARRNGVSDIVTVSRGSLDQATATYDLVVVNILVKVIIALARQGLAERVGSGGQWIAAGIIENQVIETETALKAVGLQVLEKIQIEDWVTLVGHCVPAA